MAAITAMLAMPPNAVSAGSRCPDDAYCLWTKKNFEGEKLVVRSVRLVNLPSFMNNRASSMKNHRDVPVYVYDGKNGNGNDNCIDVGVNWENLNNVGAGEHNNAISSTKPRDELCF